MQEEKCEGIRLGREQTICNYLGKTNKVVLSGSFFT